MMQAAAWQSPDFLKSFGHYDRADFAQEFLRRNPAYQRDYGRLRRRQPPADLPSMTAMARHWGLLFRL